MTWIVFFYFIVVVVGARRAQSKDRVSFSSLLTSYNRTESPFDVTGQTVVVYVTLPLHALISVEENKQIVTYIANVNFTWFDSRLSYDADVRGTDVVLIPANRIWMPRIGIFNSVMVEFADMETDSSLVAIRPGGWVSLKQTARYETMCQTDVVSPTVILPSFDKNYSIVYVTARIERNPQFYIWFLVVPTFVISVTCYAAMLLPLGLKGGEKLSMGITAFLGLTFMLSILVVEVPRSPKLPLLGWWMIGQMLFCSAALCTTVPLKMIQVAMDNVPRFTLSHRKLKPSAASSRIHIVVFCVFLLATVIFTLVLFLTAHQPAARDPSHIF